VKHTPSIPYALKEEAVQRLIKSGKEPSPENLVKMSRRKGTPLHDYFFGGKEREWADYGRYEAARKIIQSVHVDWTIGGTTIQTRAVEFVPDSEGGRYAKMQEILSSASLKDSYIAEVIRQLGLAQEKLEKFRILQKGEDKAA